FCQAEDGIRFRNVTGVQTCALPILFRGRVFSVHDVLFNVTFVLGAAIAATFVPPSGVSVPVLCAMVLVYATLAAAWWIRTRRPRSEERRVGKASRRPL